MTGSARHHGPDADVTVRRDRYGVRHVRAADERSLLHGVGYCHGRDRGLQLLLMRILAQGRTCELLHDDDEAFAFDHAMRRQHLYAGAAEQIALLSDGARHAMQAYCAGIRHALGRRVPWELRLLGIRPEPWSPADSIALFRLTAYLGLDQTQGDMERLLIQLVQAGVPRAHLEALFPTLLDGLDEALVRRVTLSERTGPAENRWATAAAGLVASNNWVLAGRRTRSGHALLANDPHLEGNRLPSVWYEVVLELADRWCVAATMPGLPMPAVGRSTDLAWGATYAFMDTTDSWIEDCRDGCHRRVVDGVETWQPFRTRTEVIRRRRGTAVTVTFHENDHGVLDGDPNTPGLRLATRWAPGSGTGAASMEAGLAILRAASVAEGMGILGRIETAWNWVLADRHGHIGYQMSGCMPRRRLGVRGVVPLPGWDADNDWLGIVAPEELPRSYDPEAGMLVTANQQLGHLGRVSPITLPMASYRADRIAAVLAARDDWDVSATAALQMDVHSIQAERFMRVLAPLLPDSPNGRLLRDWDCRYDGDSLAATLFERFYRALIVAVFGRACGPATTRFLLDESALVVDFHGNFDAVLLDPGSVWHAPAGRDAVFRRVAADALAAPARRWGDTRRFVMRHLLFGGRLPRWLGFDRGPFELRGGRATPHQGQIFRSHGRETTFMPSYRLVTDFAEEAAHTSLAGGPSDRRCSRWYATGIVDCLAGRLKTLRPRGDRPPAPC